MDSKAEKIVKRLNALKSDRAQHERIWDALAPYAAPDRGDVLGAAYNILTPGQDQVQQVYDGTGHFAGSIFANFFSGQIFNPSQKWFGLREKRPELNKRDDVREWIEDGRDRMLDDFQGSNFYAEGPECVLDWGIFGTGSMYSDEKPQRTNKTVRGYRGSRFEAARTGRFYIAENAQKIVDTRYFEFKLSARAAAERFGEDNLSSRLKNALPDQPDKLFDFIQAIEPRETGEQSRYKGAKGMPWQICYVEKEAKMIVEEGGFEDCPFFTPRYKQTPGETYGRGLGELALHDMQTLSSDVQMGLEEHALVVRPPILVRHDSVFSTLRLWPAGATKLKVPAGTPIRDAYDTYKGGANYQADQIVKGDLRKAIRQIFMVDQILMMLEVEKTQMTAEEWRGKLNLLYRLLAPVYGRFVSEFLNPLIDRQFNLMLRNGAFSDPPDILKQQGFEGQIEFDNSLARARRSEEVESMQTGIQDLVLIAKAEIETKGSSQVMDILDSDKAGRLSFEVRGVPASITRSEDEVEKIRDARYQQNLEAKAKQDAAAVAEGAGKVAPFVKAAQGLNAINKAA